jgi:hypothetical protein
MTSDIIDLILGACFVISIVAAFLALKSFIKIFNNDDGN